LTVDVTAARTDSIAAAVLDALDAGRQREPFTLAYPDFSTGDAYAVTARLRQLRTDRGAKPVGRKIGFTNRNIWAEYGVFEPIWGDMYDDTVHAIGDGGQAAIMHLPEPRIEPEILLCLDSDLTPGMSLTEIAGAVGWIAHGFEIVQSIFPGWRFKAADCVADGGLHGVYFYGPPKPIAKSDRAGLVAALSALTITLYRNGEAVDEGVGANVLDGPIQALAHLVDVLGRDPHNPPLRAGEMVTTGTLTRAFPVARGERWSTRIKGLEIARMAIEIS
jgi:2-oxo-3-hexenedioate decarboxylase